MRLELLGHDEVVEQFRRALARGRLASTFLLVGPNGIGKRTFALRLAQSLLCSARPEELLDPCGQCDACVQVAAQTHPDLHLVAKPADKSFIPLSLLVGEDGHHGGEGLCHAIALRPYMGRRRVAIIDDADYLNEEGANALLKTLEEPPPGSVLVLIGTSVDRQLPTIRSRAQIVRFRPLGGQAVAQLARQQGWASDEAEARRLADYSDGSLERARELADAELWQFRRQLLAELSRGSLDAYPLARSTLEFVDAAGKEAGDRRRRLRQLIGFALEFYRQLLRQRVGLAAAGDDELQRALGVAATAWTGGAERAAACLERCLDALAHVDRNANQATLVECWLDDLARSGA